MSEQKAKAASGATMAIPFVKYWQHLACAEDLFDPLGVLNSTLLPLGSVGIGYPPICGAHSRRQHRQKGCAGFSTQTQTARVL